VFFFLKSNMPCTFSKGSGGRVCVALIGKIKWLCFYFSPCIYSLHLLGSVPGSNDFLALCSPQTPAALQSGSGFPWHLLRWML
jgi:hypothetical protein